MTIKNFLSLKKTFRKVKTPILGAGVYAFNRIGPEHFIPDYKLLSLYSSKETNLIKKDIEVFCLEEKIGKRLKPRNSSSLLCHPETQKYLRRFERPIILLYKSSRRIEKLAKELNFRIAISPRRFGKQLFEDKIKFRKILQKIGVSPTPGRIISFSSLRLSSFSSFRKEFGSPFVIQHPRKGGGKGTFFIKNEIGFKKAKEVIREKPTKKIIVAKFIKGPSPSITGCVTRFGILSTSPQYQICDIPLLYSRSIGSGLFCGHDWSASNFSKRILSQAKEIVEKVGNYFKKNGYKGIFGLDFVLDGQREKLYLTECNPRLLGSMPTLTMVELLNQGLPIIAFHLLEYLEIPYEIDPKKINEILWQRKEGAQMCLHNPFQREVIQTKELEAGAYKISQKSKVPSTRAQDEGKSQRLELVRPGYALKHLKNKNEFLLTEGLQKKGAKIQSYQRLGRILTQKRVLNEDLKDLRPEVKKFLKLTLKSFDLK
jgi:D-alanine-D-alanine ligase-like ATP-grasp enzyme